MYIIRKEKDRFDDILTGRCDMMIVYGECMKEGERIRFVELDSRKQRTGREIYCEITWVITNIPRPKQCVKFRKVREINWNTSKKSNGCV